MSRPYAYRHRVPFEETNLVGNVYFVHYARWQGHCREAFLLEHAPDLVLDLSSGRLALVTVSCSIDYYAECFAGDTVELQMRLAATGGNRVEMAFDYVRDKQTVAGGRQVVACMQRDGERLDPVPVPEQLLTALQRFR